MNFISSLFSRSSLGIFHQLHETRRRRALDVLVFGCILMIVFMIISSFIIDLIAPHLIPIANKNHLLIAGLIFLVSALGILFLNRFISSMVARLLFIVLIFIGIFLGDVPAQLLHGRSLLYFVLPIISSSILFRPWAGYVTAAFTGILISTLTSILHLGLPDIPAVFFLILIALIAEQSTSGLERAVELEQLDKRALEISEDRFKKIFFACPIPRVVVDLQGIIMECNQSFLDVYGAVSKQKIIGRPGLDLVHPQDRVAVTSLMEELVTTGGIKSRELRCLTASGDICIMDFSAALIYAMDNAPGSIVCLLQDITERKCIEDALRANEERYRLLVETLPIGVGIHQAGKIQFINPTGARMLGENDPEKFIGQPFLGFAHPEDHQLIQDRIRTAQKNRARMPLAEERFLRLDGSSFYAEVAAVPINMQDQASMLVMFQDVTERQQARHTLELQNERLQELSRQLVDVQEQERRILAAELHDDLGQSLTSLKLMLDLASRTSSIPRRRAVLKDAHDLVSDLMAKVRNLSLDLRPAMLDDFGLYTALRWLFDRVHAQTGILIQCDCDFESDQRFSPQVETAAFRIIQEALTNIVRHAEVKQAQVVVRTGDSIFIEIRDQGTGFDLPLDKKDWRPTGGITGMQERARLLGGQVNISSQKDQGTCITAEIPLAGGA